MYKLFFRHQGEQREIHTSETSLLNKVIQEFNFPVDIEVVFCLFGSLGTELFLDPRLEAKLENENKDRLNKMVAGKAFKDLHLCYVCLFKELTLTIHYLIHELHHFQDPFECSTNYISIVNGGGGYIDTTRYIENLICTHLNDFYAEYYAVKRMVDLRYKDGQEGLHLLSIINMNLGYLKNNEQYTKDEIKEILEKKISDFDKQLRIINFLQHYIIKPFIYYLSNYRVFQERGFSNQLYENHINDFISNKIKPKLASLLTKIQQKIMDSNLNVIEQSSELRDFLSEIILSFYKNDFNDYLSELLNIESLFSSFSPPQELTRPRNYNLIEQLSNITHGFNLGWMKTLQRLNTSLMKSIAEPLSKISKLTQNLISIPKFRLNIHDDDELNEIDEEENSDNELI